LKKIIH